MAVHELFHERERLRLKGNVPDVLHYELPEPLRVQIIQVWREVLPPWRRVNNMYNYDSPPWQNEFWDRINAILKKEFATFKLSEGVGPQNEIEIYFISAPVPEAWSVVEAVFRVSSEATSSRAEWKDAVRELNHRARQHAVGYEFDGKSVIRVDNRYLHAEAVRPALLLLREKGFEGANAEFLEAHENYRHGRYETALNEAEKAFESTMKCIAKLRSIPLPAHPTAKPLIDAMVTGGVLPESLTSHFQGLQDALLLGLPRQRNRESAHGDGPKTVEVPRHVAAHGLHLAASNIVFLVESHLAKG